MVCSACGVRMCETCFRFEEYGKALCVRCAYELSTRAQRRISLGVFMALVSVAAVVWGTRQHRFAIEPAMLWVGAALGLVMAVQLGRVGLRGLRDDRVKARSPFTAPRAQPAPNARTRRAALARRVVQAASPKLSGRATAAVVLIALLGASFAFPVTMHAPRWLEIEAVLAAYWFILMLTISTLLYRGFRLHDDLFFYRPSLDIKHRSGLSGCKLDGCDPSDVGCFDVGGCDEGGGALVLGLLAVLGGVLLVTFASFLLVELLLPLAFLAFYLVLMAALKRAAHDRHDCRGRRGRAVAWGMAWASLYVVPLALVVYVLHRVAGR